MELFFMVVLIGSMCRISAYSLKPLGSSPMPRRVQMTKDVQLSEQQLESQKDDTFVKLFSTFFEVISINPDVSNLVMLCDRIDGHEHPSKERSTLIWGRQLLLAKLLQSDRNAYIQAVSFLANRIPRREFPNLEDISFSGSALSITTRSDQTIADCTLQNVTYTESPLDWLLLKIFRNMVQEEVAFKSGKKGIAGLLEEGQHYMLSEEGTPANQHAFVRRVLGGLLTPFLPPFYRIFMAGIVPSTERGDPQWLADGAKWIVEQLPESIQERVKPGTQLGPLPYAPLLTSVVTPPFLNFLVGPSRINRRKDGQLGGMIVEKCKFLQESGCKGLCLHQCKLPAQQFFADTLGVPLKVSPNFETQECQWSWGEVPLPHEQDPSFPNGCLTGCPTRAEINKRKMAVNL